MFGCWIEVLSLFKIFIVCDFGSFEILFEDMGREFFFLDVIVVLYVVLFVGGVFLFCIVVVRVVRFRDVFLGLCVSLSRGIDMDGLSELGFKGFDWLCDWFCSVVVIVVMLDFVIVGLLVREFFFKLFVMFCIDFGDVIVIVLGIGS